MQFIWISERTVCPFVSPKLPIYRNDILPGITIVGGGRDNSVGRTYEHKPKTDYMGPFGFHLGANIVQTVIIKDEIVSNVNVAHQ